MYVCIGMTDSFIHVWINITGMGGVKMNQNQLLVQQFTLASLQTSKSRTTIQTATLFNAP